MENKDLNEYIKHYLEKDKTKSAIMLTAPWGAGKSYYIQNELTPFFNENNIDSPVIVSLYGINNITDINRNLYFELRFRKIKTKKIKFNKQAKATTVTIGKTVLKGLTSAAGIDLCLSEKDLNKLYKSVDFKRKLIIFEDIERTNIDLLEFLGYINNLVEQDGAKVLLVANEQILINYESAEKYTDATKEYLKIKEKTVSDTLTYTENQRVALQNIISIFKCEKLDAFANEENINKIMVIFRDLNERNLRSFLFVCQKTTDMYSYLLKDYSEEFIENIFFSNLIFLLKMRRGEHQIWKEQINVSYSLGSEKYPLLKFCYDYINNYIIEPSDIDEDYAQFSDAKLYDMKKSHDDVDVSIIFSFATETECNIRKAIANIETRLSDISDISFYWYGALSNYLICITQFVDCDISKCLELLVANLRGRGTKINHAHVFRATIVIEDANKAEEFKKQKARMIAELNPIQNSLFDFDYKPCNVNGFCENVYQQSGRIIAEKAFMQKLNTTEFANMIFNCTADNISSIRLMFGNIYASSNVNEFLANDKNSLIQLVELLKKHEIPESFDKIQIMQYEYLIHNLNAYIEQLT